MVPVSLTIEMHLPMLLEARQPSGLVSRGLLLSARGLLSVNSPSPDHLLMFSRALTGHPGHHVSWGRATSTRQHTQETRLLKSILVDQ